MCDHDITIETYPECDIVCVTCASVIDKVYSSPTEITPGLDLDNAIGELMTDVAYNMHLPLNCINPSKHAFQKHRANVELKKYKNKELACFAVYNELIEQEIPTHLEDICRHFDTTTSRIWNIQKDIDTYADLEPCLLIPRIISELKIPYFLREEITHIVKQLELISTAKPETIAACAVYIVTKKHNYIPISSICQQCHISISSVLSLYRRYGKS